MSRLTKNNHRLLYEDYVANNSEQFYELHKDFYCGFRIKKLPKDKEFKYKIRRFSLPGISIDQENYYGELAIEPINDDRFYAINIPQNGKIWIKSKEDNALVNPGQASVGTPYRIEKLHYTNDETKQLVLLIDKKLLERLLADIIGRRVRKPISFQLGLNLSDEKLACWYNSVEFIVEELSKKTSCLHNTATQASLEQMLITELLMAQPNNYSDSLLNRSNSIAPGCVKRAESFMRDNIDKNLTLADITEAARVSPSALAASFKLFRQSSPIAFLCDLRLLNAHEDLLQAHETGESISDIARRWGFTHDGRFAKVYRQRFGKKPSETLRYG